MPFSGVFNLSQMTSRCAHIVRDSLQGIDAAMRLKTKQPHEEVTVEAA
jgi:hypothetical protein